MSEKKITTVTINDLGGGCVGVNCDPDEFDEDEDELSALSDSACFERAWANEDD